MDTTRAKTRDIARSAVRSELAQVALGLFCRDGFEEATFDDLAAAAGVSRSTFLRYFGSKEDVVLDHLDPLGDQMVEALRARPANEDGWTALRRAVDPAVEYFSYDPTRSLVLLHLIQVTPALCRGLQEKQITWRRGLAGILAARHSTGPSLLATHVHAAAALDCLNIALEHWANTNGSLHVIIDEAFAVLTTA